MIKGESCKFYCLTLANYWNFNCQTVLIFSTNFQLSIWGPEKSLSLWNSSYTVFNKEKYGSIISEIRMFTSTVALYYILILWFQMKTKYTARQRNWFCILVKHKRRCSKYKSLAKICKTMVLWKQICFTVETLYWILFKACTTKMINSV